MRKTLFKYSLIFVSVLLIIFILQKIDWFPSLKNFFVSQPIVIEETPIIIREINTLSQLITVTYADEVVMNEAKTGKAISSIVPAGAGFILVPSTDRLVLIGKGKVFAGMNLKEIKENDVHVTGDSIHVTLPPAQILNTIINPSGFETFDEKGNWNEKEVTAVKIKIKNELTTRALQQNILKQAEKRSRDIIETFLRSTGFKKVNITIGH